MPTRSFPTRVNQSASRTHRRLTAAGSGRGALCVAAVMALALLGTIPANAARATASGSPGEAPGFPQLALSHGAPLVHARPLEPGGPPVRPTSTSTPGRVQQLPGQSGYAFDIPTTGAVSISTTVTVPNLNCDAVPVRLRNYTFGLQQNLEMNGDYVMIQDFCTTSNRGGYDQYDQLNFSGAYFQFGGWGATQPYDQVHLSETRSASGITASYAAPGFSKTVVFSGGSGNSAYIGTLDNGVENPTSGGVPPYTPIGYAGTTVNGSPLGSYIQSVNYAEQDSVWADNMQDRTSDLVSGGDQFTITNANLRLPTVLTSSSPRAVHRRPKRPTTMTFKVRLSFASTAPVYLDYATKDDTAKAGVDYRSAAGTLSYPVGVTKRKVRVRILPGRQTASELDFLLSFSRPSYAYVPPGGDGVGRILPPCSSQSHQSPNGHGGSTKSGTIAVTESAGKDGFGVCPLYVKITDAGGTISPGPATSGISWLGSHNIGFKDEDGGIFQPNGIFIDTCVSGCLNILATVTDSYGQPVPDADLTATVHPLTHDVINPGGGEAGHICGAANQLSGGNRDGPCGTSIMVKTASGSPGAGQVTLRYWAPAVWVGTDKYGHDLPYPKATITFQATAHSCGGSTCFSQKSKPTDADFEIKPHPFFQQNAVLTSTERDVLVQWAENGSITTDLKAFDKELSKLKVFAPLLKKSWLHKFVNLLPYYDQMADLVIMELFDRKFGFVEDGLTNLNVHDLTTKLISYIKGESKAGKGVKKVLEWLQKKLFGVPHDYAGQLIDTLKKYAGTGGLESESASIKHLMTLKAYEASFCKGTECRGPVPALPLSNGTYYNLLVAFSSEDAQAPGSDIFFNKFNVDTGYAAPTWIPEQCLSHVDAQTKTYNGCLDNPGG